MCTHIVCVKCLEKINMTNSENFVYKSQKREYFHKECYYLLEELNNIRLQNLNYIKLPNIISFSKFDYLYDEMYDDIQDKFISLTDIHKHTDYYK